MANSLFTPVQAARSALAALRYLSVVPRTVRQDFGEDFIDGRGQVVNVRGPITVGEARTYTPAQRAARDAIVFDDLSEAFYPVKMSAQVYKAVRLPDDFATFSLEEMERQVLVPQARSVVKGIAAPLHARMQEISPSTATSVPAVAADGSNVRAVLIALRQELNRREVPLEDRFVVVGPGIEAAILSDPLLNRANESGSDGMLRRAEILDLYGFKVVAEPSLPLYFGIAFNRDAFAHVTRPSKAPDGAAASATVAQDGYALRWLRHYNPAQLEDQSVVDAFVGADILDAERAVSFSLALIGATIEIVDDTETIPVGGTFRLAVVDSAGNTIPNRLVAWSTSNAARATVDADGVVTGVATGSAATITATFGGKTDTAAITVGS